MAEAPAAAPGAGGAAAGFTPGGPYVRLLIVSAAMGLPIAVLGAAFTSLTERLREAIWTDLPDAVGWSEPAAWYVLLVPLVAAMIVALALRLPGHGGHSPVQGLGIGDLPITTLPGILLAAAATLAGGLVLGPEAPLVALGLALGTLVARMLGVTGEGTRLLGLAGAFAAIAVVLGGPLPSSLVLIEVIAMSGAVVSAALVPSLAPGFLAAGVGALAYTGIDDWPGLSHAAIEPPNLASYPSVRLVDVLLCIVVAVAVAVGVALARPVAARIERVAVRHQLVWLAGGGLAVGGMAVLFRAVTDRPVDLVLFSGQTALPAIAAETSAGVLALVVLVKAAAYAISMGTGFRGGPIFPALAIGAAGGACLAAAIPALDSTPAIVAGIAAGGAAGMRLPIFGALLAALLSGPAIAQSVPIVVVASVTAWLVALEVDRLIGIRTARASAA